MLTSLSTPARRSLSVRRPLHATVAAVDRDAARDGLPRSLARAVAWTPVVGIVVGVVLLAVARPLYYTVLREDNVVEWLQFAVCLLAAVLAGAAAVRLGRRRELLPAVLMIAVALGALLLAGEEISWGQRVFAFTTPEDLAAVNQQAEVNVHNVRVAGEFSLQAVFKVVSWLMGVAGLALALLVRGPRPVLRGPFWARVTPPLCAVPGFLGMALYWPVAVVLPVLPPLTRFQEWVEFGLHLAIAVTVLCVYLRATRPADAATDAAPTRGGWVLPVTVFAVIAVLTVVFAALTVHHGIIPVNARS
ncbi:hypothetical protein [Modestobacter roseus]|uniref:hypothetical protein n=1 Tax=Modestobacter roseus TaxID=1181884 RepID=UPI0034DE8E21